MSGHSKWAQIKRQKGATDQKRGALFTKLGNAITLAAREGGGDQISNFKLRLAIDQAKSANMPKDTIERAVKRGTGELAGGQLQELIYEGYGPGSVAVIIKVLTDNKNRTAAEIKHIMTKHQGSLGAPGSVNWQFQEKGVIRIARGLTQTEPSPAEAPASKRGRTLTGLVPEDIELKAIDLGATDVQEDEDSIIIFTDKQNFQQIKESLEQQGLSIDYAELEMVPENLISIDDKTKGQLEKLFNDLDEAGDVSDYYHNAKM